MQIHQGRCNVIKALQAKNQTSSRIHALACGSYRGIKLVEHAIKVLERVIERRVRNIVKIDSMQFGFMAGKSTTDAICHRPSHQIQTLRACLSLFARHSPSVSV